MNTKMLAKLGILTAIALTIHVLEPLIPLPIQLPGLKLGLSNIVTLFMLYTMTRRETAIVLACRVLLGAVFAGFGTIFFSAVGGLLALATGIGLRKVLKETQLWIVGILAAMAHSVGQILVAVFFADMIYALMYLPFLLAGSIVTGLITGLSAQLLVTRGKNLWKTILT